MSDQNKFHCFFPETSRLWLEGIFLPAKAGVLWQSGHIGNNAQVKKKTFPNQTQTGLGFLEFMERCKRVVNVMDIGALWQRDYEPNLAASKPGHQF
jgi:hypothetical protein